MVGVNASPNNTWTNVVPLTLYNTIPDWIDMLVVQKINANPPDEIVPSDTEEVEPELILSWDVIEPGVRLVNNVHVTDVIDSFTTDTVVVGNVILLTNVVVFGGVIGLDNKEATLLNGEDVLFNGFVVPYVINGFVLFPLPKKDIFNIPLTLLYTTP